MNERREDDALRERFRELRGEVAGGGRVPAFDAMMARARAQADVRASLRVMDGAPSGSAPAAPSGRRFYRAGAWASVAVAATVATVLLTTREPGDDAAFEQLVAAYTADVSGGAWQSPTSGLLDVPGMDLTRSVPSIGSPLRGLDPSTLPRRDVTSPEENL